MKKKPLHRISSLLAATVLGLFLLCVQAALFSLLPCQKPSYVVYYFSTSPQANPVQTGDAKL